MMMPLGEDFYRRRVQALQAHIREQAWDGMMLSGVENIIYISGFIHSPSERPLSLFVPPDGDPTLFVPLLEQENAADTWITDIRTYFEYPAPVPPFVTMMQHIDGSTIAVDEVPVTPAEVEQDALTIPEFWDRIVHDEIVDTMRYIKEPEEIACIELAAQYADYCLAYILETAPDIIQQGGTELDILDASMGATLTKMREDLGERYGRRLLKVTGTVHSGYRAALPHGEPIARVPQPGDTLIAGIGAAVAGYHAESGATFLVGEAVEDRMRCLEVAAASDAATVAALRPGTDCAAVNEAALTVIRDAGYEDAIRHRIGHGMGLKGHEAPWLAPGDATVIQPGMVFSCEPGIYRPGNDGYRTINTLLVTEGEARVLSRFLADHPPEQRILPL